MCSDCGPKYFTVNQPFIFMLRNDEVILFMGKILNPNE